MAEYVKLMEKEEDLLIENVNGKNLMEYTAEIAKWVRVSGTKEEVESLEYCKKVLDGFGYETKLSFHKAFISVPVKAFVELEYPKRISFEALGHSFAPSTPATGLKAEIVISTCSSVAGKIVLCNGLPSVDEVARLSDLGAIGAIFAQDDYLHNIGLSPIWGGPSDKTEHLMPAIPVVSITRDSGSTIRNEIEKNRTFVRIESTVDTGWRDVPLLEANLKSDKSDKFLLFSSHIDSWDYGAMDNGSANATLIECARLLARKKEQWQRGLRLVFWAGHSQGKFFSSAWYSDNHFEELEEKCVGHVYVDSTGGMDAEIIVEAPVMPQTKKLAADVIRKQTGQDFIGKRIGHYADQSFYGVGLTSIFGTFSEQDARKDKDIVSFKMGNTKFAGGLGWWWHTKHDTVDKVDEAFLVRDTKIYLAVIWRLLTSAILPYDFNAAAKEMAHTVSGLQDSLKERFDLSLLKERIGQLVDATEGLNKKISDIKEPGEEADKINDVLLKLSQNIVRITFHDNDCFDFDLSGPMFPLPSLESGKVLAKCAYDSYRYHATKLRLQRGYNRVMHYVKNALELLK